MAESYETSDDYNLIQISQFLEWFKYEIGTDYEINDNNFDYYIVFFDLESNEVDKVRSFENKLRKEEGLK
jgi:hypothetical protein